MELRNELAYVLSKKSVREFDAQVSKNVGELFALGEQHLTFAMALSANHWRQIVSRSYYGAYNVSKAVRLAVKGQYSREGKDHERIGELPDDLPNQNKYSNRLRVLRDDRNLSDYDHTIASTDLAISPAEAKVLVSDFLREARTYLRARKFRV